MFDGFRSSSIARRIGRALLAVDSWIDSSLFESGQAARARWESFVAFMDGFHVGGLRRLGLEFVCEALTLGVAGGVLMIGLALPAFQDTADKDWLKKQDLAVTFLDRYGREVGRRGIKHDDAVPIEQYPDYLIQAVVATEDRRFWEHWGIDPIGLLRALTVNAKASGVVQGGSSITQQLAKNLFLSNERTLDRKIKEAFLAIWLEAHLSKRDILKLYLDRAYMGGGTFGVQAAAEFYFGKNVRDISLAEAAMLAGLFKAPTKYAPHINLPAARARANDVLSNLVAAGYMTEGQVYAARKNPATPVDRKREEAPDWYLDYAYQEVRKLAEEGRLGNDRVLTVRTGLDMDIQNHAQTAVEDMLRDEGPARHAKQAAVVILEPQTGLLRAIIGGRDYGASQFNRATDALRQPGSSFKVFDYLTALMTGRYHGDSPIDSSAVCIGDYCVRNYNGERAGIVPLYRALAESYNTAAIRLSVKIGEAYWPKGKSYNLARIATLGRKHIIETARRMGITTPLPDTVSLPIGADAVKPIEMGAVYSLLANGGKRVLPHATIEIRNSRGKVIYSYDRDGFKPTQVFPPAKVAELNNMMTHVVTEGTGRAARLDGVMVAGKTGTTNAYRDAWFDGFTGNYVGIVWYGNDNYTPMNNVTGGSLPARTWHDIMAYAHSGIELKPPFGVPAAPPATSTQQVAATGDLGKPQRPATLSQKSTKVLGGIQEMFSRAEEGRRAETLGPVPLGTSAAMARRSGLHDVLRPDVDHSSLD